MLKVVGSSEVLTSGQVNGVDTGAPGFLRTEYGATTVWTAPLRNGSRYTLSPRAAMECSAVNSFGCAAANRFDNSSANFNTSVAVGPIRSGMNKCNPLLPDVFGKDSNSSASSASFTCNAALAASANFPEAGSRSKQIQSGFGNVLALLPVTWMGMHPRFTRANCVSSAPPTT